jgi:hypothetical protein
VLRDSQSLFFFVIQTMNDQATKRSFKTLQRALENQALNIECALAEHANNPKMTEEMKTTLKLAGRALKQASLVLAAEVL